MADNSAFPYVTSYKIKCLMSYQLPKLMNWRVRKRKLNTEIRIWSLKLAFNLLIRDEQEVESVWKYPEFKYVRRLIPSELIIQATIQTHGISTTGACKARQKLSITAFAFVPECVRAFCVTMNSVNFRNYTRGLPKKVIQLSCKDLVNRITKYNSDARKELLWVQNCDLLWEQD
jgi:hypothetical protein